MIKENHVLKLYIHTYGVITIIVLYLTLHLQGVFSYDSQHNNTTIMIPGTPVALSGTYVTSPGSFRHLIRWKKNASRLQEESVKSNADECEKTVTNDDVGSTQNGVLEDVDESCRNFSVKKRSCDYYRGCDLRYAPYMRVPAAISIKRSIAK